MGSIQTLRVITGRGKHNRGKCKLKESVIAFLKEEGIEWEEENRGSLLIKLDETHEYSFLDEERYAD
ncbi:hypothetical protein K2173_012246 [Erythroxylum novogranatense]|uniref:Smr domain-containing protein n=1 Tax=Erythroxylum novogranatense TaxID=1862640 RepID=A0AAV8SBY6_9ROSI|nr:hypothetical protein K2173_012246 [Erythroxylum novogranatense]